MLTFSTKFFAAIIILLIALTGGFFPILLRATNRAKRWLLFGESFAGGIFLGAGLVHLLPDAVDNFHVAVHSNYPYAFLICAISILFLRVIEEGATKIFKHQHTDHQFCLACLLTIVLSVHSILAGAALGIETTFASFLVIFIAIIAHKGSAAFALGVNLKKSNMPKKIMNNLMITFSVMTPFGILLGAIITAMIQSKNGALTIGIFDAIAAGTFIYIAAFHSVRIGEDNGLSIASRLCCFATGLIVMAIVAIWM